MWKKLPSHYKNMGSNAPAGENAEVHPQPNDETATNSAAGIVEASLPVESATVVDASSDAKANGKGRKRKAESEPEKAVVEVAVESEVVAAPQSPPTPVETVALVAEPVQVPEEQAPVHVTETIVATQPVVTLPEIHQIEEFNSNITEEEKAKGKNYKFKTIEFFKNKDDFFELLMGHSYCNKYSCYHNAVHQCMIHEELDGSACLHQFRICERHDEKGEKTFELQERGEHSTILKASLTRGVHPLMIIDVDEMLMANITPSQIVKALKMKYDGQPEMLALVPKKTKIISRKITTRVKGAQKRSSFPYTPPVSSVTYTPEELAAAKYHLQHHGASSSGDASASSSASVSAAMTHVPASAAAFHQLIHNNGSNVGATHINNAGIAGTVVYQQPDPHNYVPVGEYGAHLPDSGSSSDDDSDLEELAAAASAVNGAKKAKKAGDSSIVVVPAAKTNSSVQV